MKCGSAINCQWIIQSLIIMGMTVSVPLYNKADSGTSEQQERWRSSIENQRDSLVYADFLDPGWENYSWYTELDFSAVSPVHNGNYSISVRYTAAWGGLYLYSAIPLTGSDYEFLRFWIHGGTSGGQQLWVVFYDGNGDPGPTVSLTADASNWTFYEIPVSELGSPAQITGIIWQDTSGGSQPVYYLDDISLVSASGTPVPTPTAQPGAQLTIDASSDLHPISPYIYGMSFADETLAAELDLPVRRYGGNSTTRYNYVFDTANRGSDWFFENIPEDNAHPEQLPDGSMTDRFVEQDQRTGTKTLLTVPLIGWTPKSREWNWGFSVAKYGDQQEVDPWRIDAGNGIRPSGTPVTGNDPTDTSSEIGPEFVQSWIGHLTSKFGTASSSGVLFYNLDNEPMLWNGTHRDVHPDPSSYDEIVNRTLIYAPAIKSSDPDAKTLGPVVWGWTAYFYSALDWAPGGAWWLNPLDRLNHENIPFIDYYLQQMQDYETQNGVRILDYIDVHCYPQQSGVALGSAGSAATQALRLRSTRQLWDPTYIDESWINEPVRLIPRMKEWVQNNYPGTLTAVTEYNWGGHEHINGALAQADVLGIFGRESLDLACLWGPPSSSQPCAYAFRIFRNYDGNGSKFGDVSIQASSTDQSQLSVYGALRSSDGTLTIIAINKTSSNLTSPIHVSGYSTLNTVQVYHYGPSNLQDIEQKPDISAGAGLFTAEIPANTIALFIIAPDLEPVPAIEIRGILSAILLFSMLFLQRFRKHRADN